jgi:hypothetical protein
MLLMETSSIKSRSDWSIENHRSTIVEHDTDVYLCVADENSVTEKHNKFHALISDYFHPYFFFFLAFYRYFFTL